MQALVEFVAKALVDKADAVAVKTTAVEGGVLYELTVAPEDIGKVIGRDGRTVNALRTVLAAAAQKAGHKSRLEIIDDRRNQGAPAPTTVGDGHPVS